MVSTTTAPTSTALIMTPIIAEHTHFAATRPAGATPLLSPGASAGATTANCGGVSGRSCAWSVKQSVLSGLDYNGVAPASVADLLARGAKRNENIPRFNEENEPTDEQAFTCFANDQEYFRALFELRERNRRALHAKLRTMAVLRARIDSATFKKRSQEIAKGKIQMEKKVESEMADIVKACSNNRNRNAYWLPKDPVVYASPLSTDVEDFSQVTHDTDFEMLDTEN